MTNISIPYDTFRLTLLLILRVPVTSTLLSTGDLPKDPLPRRIDDLPISLLENGVFRKSEKRPNYS